MKGKVKKGTFRAVRFPDNFHFCHSADDALCGGAGKTGL